MNLKLGWIDVQSGVSVQAVVCVWMIPRDADLPLRYGKYETVHRRFTRWADKGGWEEGVRLSPKTRATDHVMLDASLVKAHQQAATGKKGAQKLRRWGVAEVV